MELMSEPHCRAEACLRRAVAMTERIKLKYRKTFLQKTEALRCVGARRGRAPRPTLRAAGNKDFPYLTTNKPRKQAAPDGAA